MACRETALNTGSRQHIHRVTARRGTGSVSSGERMAPVSSPHLRLLSQAAYFGVTFTFPLRIFTSSTGRSFAPVLTVPIFSTV